MEYLIEFSEYSSPVNWVQPETCGEKVDKDLKVHNLLDKMVEAAGIEPASESPLQSVLHI